MALIKRNTAYSLNDIVNTKYGTKLKCTTAGTTSTSPLILDGTSPITDGTVVWEVQEQGTGQGLVNYEANKNYKVGDIVIYDDKIYRCVTAHTSTTTFDGTKWEEISGAGGSGLNISKEILWSGNENTVTPTGTTLSLTNNYTDYDYLLVYFGYNTTIEDSSIKNIGLFDCSSPYNNFEYVFSSRINSSTFSTVYADIDFSGATWKISKYVTTISDIYVTKIVGIKFLPNPNNYSTTEREIGTWINGKKLYQRTITGTTPNTVGSEVVLATISGMETMVSIDGYIRDSYSNFIPIYWDNNGIVNDYIYIFTNSTGDICFKTGSSGYANKDFAIIVKYTKV